MTPDVGLAPAGPHRWEDFLSLDDDDRRELIDGHFLEIEVPNEIHEWIVTWLVTSLTNWAQPRRAGITLPSGYKVRITERRGVMPDVQFYRRGRGRLPAEGLDRGAPDTFPELEINLAQLWTLPDDD